MSLVLVLSLQAAAVATPAASAPPPAAPASPGALRWAMIDPRAPRAAGNDDPLDFDLARYRSEGNGSCGGVAGAEVLVCGPRHGRGDYPLEYWDRVFGPEPPIRAEMGLGGGATGNIHAERHEFNDRGRVANRVMVEIKLPF
jgi:hypothetical protein